jgi:hypothetical protein
MIEYILVMFMAVGQPSSLNQAVELSLRGDYEASDKILKKIKSTDVTYNFYRLINAYSLNNKKEALKWASLIEYSFEENIPQRYRDLTKIMIAEMSIWKDSDDDLEDISREMRKISDRLKNRKGGKNTQVIQKEVEDRLARMIKKLEDEQNKAKQEQQAKADAERGIQPKPEGENQPSNPATDSIKAHERGTGQIDTKRVKELANVWGKLPDKERARAMVELTRNLPTKDRAIIEAYFKELLKKGKR